LRCYHMYISTATASFEYPYDFRESPMSQKALMAAKDSSGAGRIC
jgi:hypothetical protein